MLTTELSSVCSCQCRFLASLRSMVLFVTCRSRGTISSVLSIYSMALLTYNDRFHPVFLGGINTGSGTYMDGKTPFSLSTPRRSKRNIGNKPPWMLEAKAKYGKYDKPRAERYFETMELKAPSFFPILSLLVNTFDTLAFVQILTHCSQCDACCTSRTTSPINSMKINSRSCGRLIGKTT